MPEILFERNEEGKLAFPRMDQIELSFNMHGYATPFLSDYRQVREYLLQVVRIRAEDPHVRRIGHVLVPRALMTDKQLQEELEQLVPSLVLIDEN